MYIYAIHYRDVYDEEKLAAASGAFIDLYTPFPARKWIRP